MPEEPFTESPHGGEILDWAEERLSYAEQLRRKGVQTRTGGWSHATKDEVAEWRTEDGSRFKATRDGGGNIVTEETTPSGKQRKHVTINLG